MSKVYSFRLSNDNPREAQARVVIESWVGEGYSLRHVLTEALLSLHNYEKGVLDIGLVVDELIELVRGFEGKQIAVKNRLMEKPLPTLFTGAIKNSARLGIRNE